MAQTIRITITPDVEKVTESFPIEINSLEQKKTGIRGLLKP